MRIHIFKFEKRKKSIEDERIEFKHNPLCISFEE